LRLGLSRFPVDDGTFGAAKQQREWERGMAKANRSDATELSDTKFLALVTAAIRLAFSRGRCFKAVALSGILHHHGIGLVMAINH
jgi:hypothetical protein